MLYTEKAPTIKGAQKILVRRGGEYDYRWVERINPETGEFERVHILLPCGRIEQEAGGDNLALTRMKTQLSHLIVGHDTTVRFINRVAWGTGGHVQGDSSQPIAPSVGDSTLESTILVKPLTMFEFPSPTSVLITAYILEGEANGFAISETGLLTGDSSLVARRTFAALSKSSEWVFEQKWLLAF